MQGKEAAEQETKAQSSVGIDVSKDWLDVCVLPGGERLQLWDTPGFGNSARLLQRLRLADNPIGWLLREAWDRWRD